MELWKTEEFSDAIRYSCHWMPEGLASEAESKSFNKELVKFWEFIELECQENAEFMFSLYEMLKKAKNGDDEMLCTEPKNSEKVIEDIQHRHKPRSETVGLKMLYELFPRRAYKFCLFFCRRAES
jgi:hypothetical protein